MPFSPSIVRHANSDDETTSLVYSRLAQSKSALQTTAWEWYDAIQFARGDQWTYWDPGARRIRRRPQLPWRIRVTDNQVLPLIEMQQALLTEKLPTFRAMARTSSRADMDAALAFEALLIYHWDRLDLTEKLSEAIHVAVVTGNGFWTVRWNADSGRSIDVPMPDGYGLAGDKRSPKAEVAKKPEVEEEFLIPGLDQPPPPTRSLHEGDIDIRVVSPFSMHVDLAARSLGDAKWVAQETYVHLDILRDIVGNKLADKMRPDVGEGEYHQLESNLRFDSKSSKYLGDDQNSAVRVIEFWEAPTRKNPEGMVYTVASGLVVDKKKNPYGGRFPYVHFPNHKVHGRFWAEGVVKHLRPLQTMHNRAVSRYHEIMNLMANPKWIVDKGSGIKETAINDRPGEVLFKAPGSQVLAVAPPPAPTVHPQIMSMALNAMQTISGVNDPLVGNNPANVRSGRSLAFLQEAGMRRFVPMALQTESALRHTGRLIMSLVKRFYDEERIVRILGKDARAHVYRLDKANIDRIEDVTIVHGSMIPKSRAAQQDNALELLARAPMLFVDEEGKLMRDALLNMMDMPAATGRLTTEMEERNFIKQEHIEAIEGRGEGLAAQAWENDLLHMKEHKAWLLSAEARENPDAMLQIASHFADHANQLSNKMSGQAVDIDGMARQEGNPGQGPGSPAPGGSSGSQERGLPIPDPGAGFPGGSR